MATLGEGTSVGVDEAYVGVTDGMHLLDGSEPVPVVAGGGVIIIDEGVMS